MQGYNTDKKECKVGFGEHGVGSSSSRRNLRIVVDEQLQLSKRTSQQENLIDMIFGNTVKFRQDVG